MNFFTDTIEFDWDEGNRDKNLIKHQVTNEECEEVFFDPRKRLLRASFPKHEERHLLIGKTLRKRALFVVFTVRKNKVRVISARDLGRKDRRLYEKES